MATKDNSVIIFQNNKIRRLWNNQRELWYFSVIDVIAILTESNTPVRYWSDLKTKLKREGSDVYDKIVKIKFIAQDGKKRPSDCFSTENLFRLIQSIPSPKAEPLKLWLAKVGYQRLEEIEDPELAINRALQNYLKKGYSKEWINQRLKTIEVRKELTDEWQSRGIEEGLEFAILTNEITKAWSGKTVREYKNFKNLKKENLRDNMTNLELVLNTLAEATTTEISKDRKPKTFDDSKQIARRGGQIAGNTRKEIEQETKKKVISPKNSKNLATRSIN